MSSTLPVRGAVAALAIALLPPAGARAGSPPPRAGDARAERRAWYLPDHAKLQLAGSIGFLSPGLGYSWLDRRLEADVFFGWVPPRFGGERIVSLTGKLGVAPWRVQVGDWALRPATAAMQLTYTLGDEYWLRLPSRYPDDYYPVPTALRSGIAVGAAVGRALGALEHVGIYFEIVAVDFMLGHWIDNRRTIDLADVVSVAVGARADL